MGFLSNIFNKKKIHPAVKYLYDKVDPTIKEKVFYGGLETANELLLNIANNAFGKANDSTVNVSFQIYLQVLIRSHGGLSIEFSTPEYITEVLCEKFSFIPSQTVVNCINLSLEHIYKNEPELYSRNQIYEALQNQVSDEANKNQHLFDLYLNDKDYGRVSEKPVFVAGFGGAKTYLSQIINSHGATPEIERLGSMQINGISGPVDLYTLSFEIADSDEFEIHQIYICNYGFYNSPVAPAGLKLRK